MLSLAMRRYKKAYNMACFTFYVFPILLLIGALLVWLSNADSFNSAGIWSVGIVLCIHIGYAIRYFYDAKERISEIGNIVASVRELGFKVVHNPVDGDQISPGLQIVHANHPDPEIKARWGRWDALAQFDD